MAKILAIKNGFKLYQSGDFCYIKTPEGRTMVNISGSREKVANELKRWKRQIDYNNRFMLEVENAFLDILNSC